MSISTGDDGVLDDVFSYQIYNKIKNHWRGSTAPANPQAGMIFSDSDDDKLYYWNGAAWVEIEAGGGGAPVDAQYVVLALNGTLTTERVLTGTANQITVTDGGAGTTVTLSIPSGAILNIDDIQGTTEVTVTEGHADLDFRVEGNTVANLFQTDAGNDEVIFGAFAGFAVEFDNGNSGAAKTIDWGKSNKQTIAMTDDCTFTFTAPGNKGNVLLKVTTANSKVITFPGTVKWPGGVKPTASTGATDVDIYTWYFDGTNYYGNGSLDFS